jgi:hypothetical protein
VATTQDNTTSQGLLDQQRVLAAFGAVALGAEDLDALLTEACRLVGQALETDLAKVVEFIPDSETMMVRAGVGWNPGVVNETLISAGEDSAEGLTLKDGAVISADRQREKRFAYHDFLKEHGVQAFVNVLIPSGKGRAPVWRLSSRQPFTPGVPPVRHRLPTYLRKPPGSCHQSLAHRGRASGRAAR